ncbi:hypothetical protein Tco_0511724 [Tanacetum coccineum]
MLPEWSRFITEVKLNRGLKESNCDQLYAYLKQHEVHANENRIMMERFGQPNNDPLALVRRRRCISLKVLQQKTWIEKFIHTHLPSSLNRRIRTEEAFQSGQSETHQVLKYIGLGHITHVIVTCHKRLQDSDYFKDKVTNVSMIMWMIFPPENDFLALNVDMFIEAAECDAFDLVDEGPITQSMIHDNSIGRSKLR